MLCGQQDWEGKREQALSLSLSPQSWPSGGGSAPVKSKQLLVFDFTESRNGLGWKFRLGKISEFRRREKQNKLFKRVPSSKASSQLRSSWNAGCVLGCTKGELNLWPAFGVSLLLLEQLPELEKKKRQLHFWIHQPLPGSFLYVMKMSVLPYLSRWSNKCITGLYKPHLVCVLGPLQAFCMQAWQDYWYKCVVSGRKNNPSE